MSNFDYDDTEAEHLSEIYDGCEVYDKSYSRADRADYVHAKGLCFKKEDIGKYVVVQNSRRSRDVMPTMYLVDRSKTKRMWWSPDSYYAMVFETKSAAEYQAKRYKFNKPRVQQIKSYMADKEWFEEMYN